MSVLRVDFSSDIDAAEVRGYLQHVVQSDRFHKAPSLRHLLEYLVTETAEGRIDGIKESVIALDVFGRSRDFDGRLDNIVRVQAHRLRKLLEAYYATDGAADRFQISIPKGSYIPRLYRQEESKAETAAVEVEASEVRDQSTVVTEFLPQLVSPKQRRHSFRLVLGFTGVFLAGMLVSSVFALKGRIFPDRAQADESLRRAPLSTLWGSVLQPGAKTVVSFTNPVFLWTQGPKSRLYMNYQGPLSAQVGTQVDISPGDPYVDSDLARRGTPFFFSDSWTGTGEVFSIQRLTRLFAEAGVPLRVIRSRALTYDDIRGSNVIFLGSPWANELQDKFNAGNTTLTCVGTGRIINHDPRPGEPADYASDFDPKTKQLTVSYALFTVLPGVSPGTKILISAGIDTYGTSAAIDFMTSAAGVRELIQRLDSTSHRILPDYWQAVVRSEMIRGEPFNPTVVLVRELDRKANFQQTSTGPK